MQYNKALENYRNIVLELNNKISERTERIEKLKSEIRDVKEGRKQEIKNGIFTNSIKKFTRANDITDKATEIEILICEIEALNELKNGESKDLMKAAKELMKATNDEVKRIHEDRQAREVEAKRLYDKSIEIKTQLNSINEFATVTSETANAMTDLIKVKYPKEYENYISRGVDILTLAQRLIEES